MLNKAMFGFIQQHPSTFTEGAMYTGLATNWSSFKSSTESAWTNDTDTHEGDVALCDNGNAYMFIAGSWKAL